MEKTDEKKLTPLEKFVKALRREPPGVIPMIEICQKDVAYSYLIWHLFPRHRGKIEEVLPIPPMKYLTKDEIRLLWSYWRTVPTLPDQVRRVREMSGRMVVLTEYTCSLPEVLGDRFDSEAVRQYEIELDEYLLSRNKGPKSYPLPDREEVFKAAGLMIVNGAFVRAPKEEES